MCPILVASCCQDKLARISRLQAQLNSDPTRALPLDVPSAAPGELHEFCWVLCGVDYLLCNWICTGHRFYANADPGNHAPGNSVDACMHLVGIWSFVWLRQTHNATGISRAACCAKQCHMPFGWIAQVTLDSLATRQPNQIEDIVEHCCWHKFDMLPNLAN